MEDLKTFTSAINQIAEEKGISKEKILETIELAIAAAYKKEYGKKGQIVRAKLDSETGQAKFWQIKSVVEESMILSEEELEELIQAKEARKEGAVSEDELRAQEEVSSEDNEEKKVRFNPEKHIILEEARKIKKDIKVGEELELPLETHEDFGRIASQTAKQVVIQRIREAERDAVMEDFKSKEGEIISGIVQRIEGRTIFFDLGRTTAVLMPVEQIPKEFYRIGQRLRLYVLQVEMGLKEPVVFVSRAHPKILTKLFELEVPEIAAGTVVIKGIAREAGFRSKIAVASTDEKIDPIGSCVGQKGSRIATVINELGGEKLDIIAWSDNPEQYIANALAPAKVLEVTIQEKNNLAIATVPEEQVSLAIGREGQNVRLAAKLTGWKIDIRSAQKPEESAIPEELSKIIEEEEGQKKEGESEDLGEAKTENEESEDAKTKKKTSKKKSQAKKE